MKTISVNATNAAKSSQLLHNSTPQSSHLTLNKQKVSLIIKSLTLIEIKQDANNEPPRETNDQALAERDNKIQDLEKTIESLKILNKEYC